jgi:hypothetical protein
MGIRVALRPSSIFAVAALLFASEHAPATAGSCVGPDPTIQASNTLQFADVYRGSTKLDSRGIPPLKAGQSYVFQYVGARSAQAGAQTTSLGLRMDVREPANTGSQSCNTSNGVTMVRF